MPTKERKQLAVRVDTETYKKLKIFAIEKGITIQEYFTRLLEKDMKEQEKRGR